MPVRQRRAAVRPPRAGARRGRTYVARGTLPGATSSSSTYTAGGIAHRGFSMVEAMATARSTTAGSISRPTPRRVPQSQKEHAVPAAQYHEGETRSHEQYPVGAAAPPRARGVRDGAAARERARRPVVRSVRPAIGGPARPVPATGRVEIRCSGSGGQGILLAAAIIAVAAAALGRYVVQTQSYGPEARAEPPRPRSSSPTSRSTTRRCSSAPGRWCRSRRRTAAEAKAARWASRSSRSAATSASSATAPASS